MADAVDLRVPLGHQERSEWLKSIIRDIPDFPSPGILFRDITPLLQDARALRTALEELAEPFKDAGIDQVVGVESRGFIFGAPLAMLLNAGFVPVRKFGKLPGKTIHVEYALEYGSNTVEIHTDAIQPGQKILVVDDLLATGGTVGAALDLVQRLGGEVVGIAFLVELTALQGRQRLQGQNVFSLIQY
ncbi:MAG TPA: adenine phosphoribosyltransferase [Ktedonobacterales bacterium]|nr:adenine phosphoribosyltransferase [Ktedonobacterales bacterium]